MSDPAESSLDTSGREVLSVSELNEQLRTCLQLQFRSVWVAGEISDLARPRSGHIYFTLKDDTGQLRAIVWRSTAGRLKFELEDGMQVVCEGQIDIYPPRGNYQIILRKIEPQGIGSLQLALNQLREKLAAEGLFDDHRKRPLPRFPRRIAIVTSPTGAAIRDFLEVHRRRWSGTEILIIPTRVQGNDAAPEIADAIELTQFLRPAPDAVVVTRGGGSLEDLWCFNDERVVRAVAALPLPVISAVGHEIDVTLCDLAADLRALTPSEAAELITPSRDDLLGTLRQTETRLHRLMTQQLSFRRSRVDAFSSRPALANPMQPIHDRARRVDDLEARLQRAVQQQIDRGGQHLSHFAGQLEALSPLAVMSRGYCLAQLEDGRLVRSVSDASQGDALHVRVRDGIYRTAVESKKSLPLLPTSPHSKERP